MSDDTTLDGSARIVAGVAAGLVAGVVAAFAMDCFQAAATALSGSGSDGESATAKAADKLGEAVAGRRVPSADKPLAGQLVHYALGAGLGVAYGLAAEFRPAVTAGYGTAFGLGAAALLDEAAVPATGLAPPPWRTPPATHAYTLASHIVFGLAGEFTRRQVRKTWRRGDRLRRG